MRIGVIVLVNCLVAAFRGVGASWPPPRPSVPTLLGWLRDGHRFAFRQDPFGVAYISTVRAVIGGSEEPIEAVLTLNADWAIGVAPFVPETVPPTIYLTNGERGVFRLRAEEGRDGVFMRSGDASERISHIGFGHGSTLLADARALSVVRRGPNGGELILFSTMAEFEAACVPGTVLHFLLRRVVGFHLVADVVVDLVEAIGDPDEGQFRSVLQRPSRAIPLLVQGPFVVEDRMSPPSLFTVSGSVAAEIRARLTASGAQYRGNQSQERPEIFDHCTREMVGALPLIQLTFIDGFTQELFGSIRFEPQEYMDSKAGGVCESRYAVESSTGFSSFRGAINPLLFPGINFFINGHMEIAFGDARFDE